MKKIVFRAEFECYSEGGYAHFCSPCWASADNPQGRFNIYAASYSGLIPGAVYDVYVSIVNRSRLYVVLDECILHKYPDDVQADLYE